MAKSTNSTNKKKNNLSTTKQAVKLKSKQPNSTTTNYQKNIPVDSKKERLREKAVEKSRQVQKKTVPKKKKTTPISSHLTNTEVTKNQTVEVKKSKTASTKQVKKTEKKSDKVTSNKTQEKKTLKSTPKVSTKNKTDSLKSKPKVENKEKKKTKSKPLPHPSITEFIEKNKGSFRSFFTTKRIIHLLCFVVLALLVVYGIYFLFFRKTPVTSLGAYDSLNSLILDGTDIVAVGSSNFKYSDFYSYTGGKEQAKLIKYDKTGKVLFEEAYVDCFTSEFRSIILVDDGYVVVGSYELDQDDRVKIGLIIHYDKEGNIVWQNDFATNGNTIFYDVDEVEDGYVVVGQSLSDDDSKNGAVIVKYNKTGTLVWRRYFGNTDSTSFKAVEVADDRIYAVGIDQKDIGILTCYRLDGTYDWHKEYLYTDDLGLSDILYFKDNLYVVGSKKVLDPDEVEGEHLTTNTDAMLLKYSLSGELLFEKSFGGSNLERYNALTAYGDNIFVVGYSNSKDSGLKIFTDGKKKTGIFVRYDLDGEMEKKTTFGGSNNDNLTAIVTDNSNLYITGYSNSKDGNLLSSHENGRDYFGKLVKIDSRLRVLFIK